MDSDKRRWDDGVELSIQVWISLLSKTIFVVTIKCFTASACYLLKNNCVGGFFFCLFVCFTTLEQNFQFMIFAKTMFLVLA